MKVLVLGGNSQRHYVWIRQLGAALKDQGFDPILQDYAHWDIGGPLADIEREIITASNLMKDIEEYAVVAKSVGTVIAGLGVSRGLLSPTRVVMLGVPYEGIAGDVRGFKESLTQLPPSIFIQNQDDPYGDAKGLQGYVPEGSKLIEIPDNATHDYTDFDQIIEFLS